MSNDENAYTLVTEYLFGNGARVLVDPCAAEEAAAALEDVVPKFAAQLRADLERNSRARSKWKAAFQEHVNKISAPMIRAEMEKMSTYLDEWGASRRWTTERSSNGRASVLDDMKNEIPRRVAREQKAIASGRLFRQLFGGLNPCLRAFYMETQVITPEWLIGFSNDEALREQYQKEAAEAHSKRLRMAQLAGAAANRKGRETRKAEACRIYAAPNPETGAPWESKEMCIKYLMGTRAKEYGWSRAAIIGYLPKKATNSSARKAPKKGR